MNVPLFNILEPTPINGQVVKIVHHGVAVKGRGLEHIIRVFKKLDSRFTLTFYLVPTDSNFFYQLKKLAGDFPRIEFRDPVPTSQIPKELNSYDIGIFLAPPVSFNHQYTLPNKFFEFTQARLMLLLTPSFEMTPLVERYGNGVVFSNFKTDEIVDAINQLGPSEIELFKKKSALAAHDLCWENNQSVLINAINRL
jgi:glycosyltransferase involved in cell wall biosynthesis